MVSILLPTFNGEKYIKESIDSVLNQTFADFELLIGLNGTTDNTKQILSNYSDSRIRIFDFGSDKGKSKTLNRLLESAKYDYIALQDDDDIWIDRKLENQVDFIRKFDVVGTFIEYINELGQCTSKLSLSEDDHHIKFRSFNLDNQVANTSALFKRKSAMDVNGWDDKYDGIEDYNFWLKLMKKGNIFHNIPQFLVKHRIHPNSNFNTKTYDLKSMILDVLKK
jgi:glycosyltransferase involved in cell wall biosynthesis